MRSYLKGHKLWLYVSGDRPIPEQVDKETDSSYAIQIEDWESANYQIITWFVIHLFNPLSMSLATLILSKKFGTYFVTQYVGLSGACNFKLTCELYHIRQEPIERITVYHRRLKSIWDQLIAFEPVLSNYVDTK